MDTARIDVDFHCGKKSFFIVHTIRSVAIRCEMHMLYIRGFGNIISASSKVLDPINHFIHASC